MTPAVMDHFLNPRNVGDIAGADGVGEVGAVSCGDVMRILDGAALKQFRGDARCRDGRAAAERAEARLGNLSVPGFLEVDDYAH